MSNEAAKKISKYFVWVTGLLGPQPQIWYGDLVDGNSKGSPSLFKCKLESDEENLSVDQLAEKYKDKKDG